MTGEIAIRITGDDIEGALTRLINRARATAPAMREIAATLGDSIEHAFDTQASPETGVPWPALAPSTLARRGAAARMLQLSGGLISSLSTESDEHRAVAGLSKVYARANHFGTKGMTLQIPAHQRLVRQAFGRRLATPVTATVRAHTRPGNLPARPFAGLSPGHRAEVLGIIARHLALPPG